MNSQTQTPGRFPRTAVLLITLLLGIAPVGCYQFKGPFIAGRTPQRIPDTSEASAVYALACTGMATAGTPDEFNAALSAMDNRTGLDFSGENPVPLIKALRHGTALMAKEAQKADKDANSQQRKLNLLKQKMQALEKEVATLKHQISVLENIDQERRQKRKAQ